MRVPVYERQVGINAMPGARVNAPGDANAYGAGIGAAVTDAAEKIESLYIADGHHRAAAA